MFQIGSNGVDGRQAVLLENRIVFGVVVEVDGVAAVNDDWLRIGCAVPLEVATLLFHT